MYLATGWYISDRLQRFELIDLWAPPKALIFSFEDTTGWTFVFP